MIDHHTAAAAAFFLTSYPQGIGVRSPSDQGSYFEKQVMYVCLQYSGSNHEKCVIVNIFSSYSNSWMLVTVV